MGGHTAQMCHPAVCKVVADSGTQCSMTPDAGCESTKDDGYARRVGSGPYVLIAVTAAT